MRRVRLTCYLLLGTLVIVAPLCAMAESPVKGPVRILVPVPAGAASDIAARLIADNIKEALGQSVIIENRPGATGRIAAEALKSATPDGTTFLMAPIAMAVLAPMVLRRLSFDPTKDFAPVTQVAKFQYAFAVAPSHPARTVPEFIAWGQANSGQVSFGTPGAGSVPHFFGLMVSRETGLEMVHVPYTGAGRLTADLMGDQVPSGVSTLSELIELHRAGKVRIIATTGSERSPALPAVPTFKEQGFPKIEGIGWTALYAPAGTPKPVIDRLAGEVAKALRTPAVREKLINLGLEPTGTTPAELAAIMVADTARWAPIIKTLGFKAD